MCEAKKKRKKKKSQRTHLGNYLAMNCFIVRVCVSAVLPFVVCVIGIFGTMRSHNDLVDSILRNKTIELEVVGYPNGYSTS